MEFTGLGKRVLPYSDDTTAPKRTKCPSPTSINFILNNINDDSSKNSSSNEQQPTNSFRSPPPNTIESIASQHHPNTYPSLTSTSISHQQPNTPYLTHSLSQVNTAPPHYFLSHSYPQQYPPPPLQAPQHPFLTLPPYPQLISHASNNQTPPLRSPQLHQPQAMHHVTQSHPQSHHLELSPRSGTSPHYQMYNHPRPLSPPRHSYPQPTLQFSPHIAPAKQFESNSSSTSSANNNPSSSILQHLQPKMFKANRVNTRYITIGEDLLKMRQNDAARRLGIAPSTFSKRWRQTLPERKWPFRQNVKTEKNIKTLQKFESKGHDVSMEMDKLLRQKAENLRDALILIQNDDVSEEYSEGGGGAVEDDQEEDKADEEDE